MSDPKNLEAPNFAPESAEPPTVRDPASEAQSQTEESFGEIFSQYEKSHARKPDADQSREGTVISVTAASVILDIGFKSEGLLPLPEMRGAPVKPGDKLKVTIKGRDPEGYYQLTRGKVQRVTDWDSLKKA